MIMNNACPVAGEHTTTGLSALNGLYRSSRQVYFVLNKCSFNAAVTAMQTADWQ